MVIPMRDYKMAIGLMLAVFVVSAAAMAVVSESDGATPSFEKVSFETDGSDGSIHFYFDDTSSIGSAMIWITTSTSAVTIFPNEQVKDEHGLHYTGNKVADLSGPVGFIVSPPGGGSGQDNYAEGSFTVGVVSFDGNGASGTMDPVRVGGSYTLPECGFTHASESFEGWSVGEATYAAGTVIEITGDMTLTAKWTSTPTTVPVTGVGLDRDSADVAVGGSVTLTATVLPGDATNKAVTWESSDSNVATVDNGVVTGVSAGTATITVTTVDGDHTATCTVTVEDGGPVAPVLAGIKVTAPTKTTYFVQENLDLEGMTVVAVYDDRSEKALSPEEYTVNPADGSVLNESGSVEVVVSYGGKTAKFSVSVEDVSPEDIYIKTEPKKEYLTGDTLDLSGMVVMVKYNDGHEEPYDGYITDPENGALLNTIGTHDVKIIHGEYGNIYCTFSITVTKAPIKDDTVAMVGSEEFNDLQKAFDAAKDGGTVVLVTSATNGSTITLKEEIEVGEQYSVKLDLNGRTLVSEKGCILMNSGMLVIVGNGTMISEREYSACIQNIGDLTIYGGVYRGTAGASEASIMNGGTLVINGGEFHSGGSSTESGSYAAILNIESEESESIVGNMTINGGSFDGLCAILSFGGDIAVNGGSFNVTYLIALALDVDVSITGGSFDIDNFLLIVDESNPFTGKISVSGGTYSKAIPEEYIADGFELRKNSNGTYTVIETVPVTPGDDDDDLVPFPPDKGDGGDDTTTVIAVIAAAAVVALLAIIIIAMERKR